jgi:hypothetical protein
MSVSSFNMDRERKTIAVRQCHDFRGFSGTRDSNTRSPFLAGT